MLRYTLKKQGYAQKRAKLFIGLLVFNTLYSCTHTNDLLKANEEAEAAKACIERLENVSSRIPGVIPYIVNKDKLEEVEKECKDLSKTKKNIANQEKWGPMRIIKWLTGLTLGGTFLSAAGVTVGVKYHDGIRNCFGFGLSPEKAGVLILPNYNNVSVNGEVAIPYLTKESPLPSILHTPISTNITFDEPFKLFGEAEVERIGKTSHWTKGRIAKWTGGCLLVGSGIGAGYYWFKSTPEPALPLDAVEATNFLSTNSFTMLVEEPVINAITTTPAPKPVQQVVTTTPAPKPIVKPTITTVAPKPVRTVMPTMIKPIKLVPFELNSHLKRCNVSPAASKHGYYPNDCKDTENNINNRAVKLKEWIERLNKTIKVINERIVKLNQSIEPIKVENARKEVKWQKQAINKKIKEIEKEKEAIETEVKIENKTREA